MELLTRLRTALAGRYDITAEIGRGGMATVYQARDCKHDRLVAVKVLDPELAAVLGVERFLGEIRVTANLQHPNLLPLFDSGEYEGHLYYVMPFVAGESLRARLDREKQLSIEESLHIATAVGNALDYAHSHGVVHRDLKPENILLQHGQPIVADFGIALAISNAGGSRITQTGLSLGTPQYMSPEQASGDRVIDGRSDVYSLSAILYEMLSGEPPHTGPTVQAVVAKVLTESVARVRTRRASVPPPVEHALEKGLAKLPADRFATAQQFVEALHDASVHVAPDAEPARGPNGRRAAALIGSVVVLSIAAGVAGWMLGHRSNALASRVIRFNVALPLGTRAGSYFGALASISPNGRQLAYVGPASSAGEIWVRDLDADQGRAIAGASPSYAPRFSPDGRWIYWFESSRLAWMKTPLAGGPITEVFRTSGPVRFDWFGSDSIVFTHAGVNAGSRLLASATTGGTPRPFLVADSSARSVAEWQPALAPDDKTLFFVSRRRDGDIARDELAYATLDERRAHVLPIAAQFALGYAAGAIIYAQANGAIMAVPFDLRRRRITGSPLQTNETALVDGFGIQAMLSRNGDLVYQRGASESRLVTVGAGTAIQELMIDRKQVSFPRLSPDGRHIAVTLFDGTRTDVWIYSIASKSFQRLTSAGSDNQRPEWSPDSRYVIYRSNQSGEQALWRQLADFSGGPERVTPPLRVPVHEGVVSPDGQTVMFRVDDPVHARDIYTVPFGRPDATPRLFLGTEFDELTPRFSPDGKWVAYVSNESGRDEVYVRAYPGPGGRTLISTGGGNEPIWSHDGRRIFYRAADAVVAARVTLGETPTVAARDTVVSGPYLVNRFHPMYDVTRDDKQLLLLQTSSDQLLLTVILNWADAIAAKIKQKE